MKCHERRVFRDASGNTPLESYFVKGMGHAIPIDPGAAREQCGTPAEFAQDVGICSSF